MQGRGNVMSCKSEKLPRGGDAAWSRPGSGERKSNGSMDSEGKGASGSPAENEVGMGDGVKETKKRSGREVGRGFVSRLLAVWYQVSVEGWTGMGEERRSDRNL